MARLPTGILTPLQIRVLKALEQEPALKGFYLSGGTALSAFYLGHRLSEDLDFFTQEPGAVPSIHRVLSKVARTLKLRIELGRRFETFYECALIDRKGERIEMDFAQDVPKRLAPVRAMRGFALKVDNPLDIGCNKFSALLGRVEAKDFVDIFFLHERFWPLRRLLPHARKKYPDLDDYSIAVSFFKVKDILHWPRMLTHFDPLQARDFFLAQGRHLAGGIFNSQR